MYRLEYVRGEGPGFKCMSPDTKSVENGRDIEGFEKNVHGGQM